MLPTERGVTEKLQWEKASRASCGGAKAKRRWGEKKTSSHFLTISSPIDAFHLLN